MMFLSGSPSVAPTRGPPLASVDHGSLPGGAAQMFGGVQGGGFDSLPVITGADGRGLRGWYSYASGRKLLALPSLTSFFTAPVALVLFLAIVELRSLPRAWITHHPFLHEAHTYSLRTEVRSTGCCPPAIPRVTEPSKASSFVLFTVLESISGQVLVLSGGKKYMGILTSDNVRKKGR